MTIFFAFSDEAGNYQKKRSSLSIKRDPFYVRSTYIIHGNEWKELNEQYNKLKVKYSIPKQKEVKWNYLWSIYRDRLAGKQIAQAKPYYFLRNKTDDELLNFIIESLNLLSQLNYLKIIITITNNTLCPLLDYNTLIEFHLQDVMQRIEMEIQDNALNLCILFIDPVSNKNNKRLCDVYNNLYNNGDFIQKYSHIKDCLDIEYSHQSTGIQLADFISGCSLGALKCFQNSLSIFQTNIKPFIRTSKNHIIMGYGVIDVPKNPQSRQSIKNLLQI